MRVGKTAFAYGHQMERETCTLFLPLNGKRNKLNSIVDARASASSGYCVDCAEMSKAGLVAYTTVREYSGQSGWLHFIPSSRTTVQVHAYALHCSDKVPLVGGANGKL